jgi:hypothetical protein
MNFKRCILAIPKCKRRELKPISTYIILEIVPNIYDEND